MPSAVLKLFSQHYPKKKSIKRHKSVKNNVDKNVDGVMALHLCMLPENTLHLYQVPGKYLRKYLKGFRRQ